MVIPKVKKILMVKSVSFSNIFMSSSKEDEWLKTTGPLFGLCALKLKNFKEHSFTFLELN